jgi:hypothetical protein
MNIIPEIRRALKNWSQFLFGSWRNNLNQVLHKGVYNLIEVISNEPIK